MPRPTAARVLAAVFDRLSEQRADWITPPELLAPHHRTLHPHGRCDLGVAHGVPGVVALLAGASRLGIREEKAHPLLEEAVRRVLSHRLPDGRFPAWVAPGIEPQPSRLAWCYGAPGVAATLLPAARVLGNEEREGAALDLALQAAMTPPEACGVQDGGLCHGALGLAHLYNRIYQSEGDERFAAAARLWYSRGLDFRRPGAGIAGFASREFGADLQPEWRADPGFLAGAAGIGLALLAGIRSVEPEWDRLLMLRFHTQPASVIHP